MEKVWYTPEENMPPYGKPVLLEIEFKYGYRMHAYGVFEPAGWYLLRDFPNYKVVKWRYFKEG